MDSSNIKRKESADAKRENVPEASVDNPDEHKSVADNRILLERLSDVGQFIHVRAEIWFWKIEAVFRIAGITDQKVMADAVIACLDQELMLIVKDLVRKPHPVKPYQKLKSRIMRSCTTAAKTRLDKILEVRHDEHFKPSQMLREMHMINDGTLNESDIRTLFMQHMQERCRKILEASQITDVEQLACLADAVEDVLRSSTIEAYKTSSCFRVLNTKVDELTHQVRNLTLSMMDSTSTSSRTRSQSSDPQHPQFRGRQRPQFRSRQRPQFRSRQRPQFRSRQRSRFHGHQSSQSRDYQRSQFRDHQRSQFLDDQQFLDLQRLQSRNRRRSHLLVDECSQFLDDLRSQFLGDQHSQFHDDQRSQFLDDQRSQFLDDQHSQFHDDQRSQFLDDQRSQFLDDQRSQFLDDQRSQSYDDQRSQFRDDQRLQSRDHQRSQSRDRGLLQSCDDQRSQFRDDQRSQSRDHQRSQSCDRGLLPSRESQLSPSTTEASEVMGLCWLFNPFD